MRPLRVRRSASSALAFGLLAAAACGGADATRGGAVVIATGQDPDGLFPPTGTRVESRAVFENVFEKLADLGPALNTVGDEGFEPRLAQRWDWSRDSLRVTFHLDPRARWHDGHPVRAADVRFGYAVYTDPRVNARGGGDLMAVLDSVSADDSLTCTAWFKNRTPEQFNTLVSTLVPLPEHLLGRVPRDSLRTSPFVRAPVGNGPFRFARWDPRQRVEIAAVDSFYRGRPKLDRVIWTIAPEMATAVQKLLAGEADFFENLTLEDAAEVAKRADLRLLPLGSFYYFFLQFNLRDGATERPHPIFADRALRRALTMALNRPALVRSVFDSLGHVALGPLARGQWAADTTLPQLPFDRPAAARTLDSLGWRAGPDGMRARSGRLLAFTVLVPSSSKNRQRFAVLMQEQLRNVGVRADVDLLDFSAWEEREKAHRFDAAIGALQVTPSASGLRQTWTSAAAAEGGFNYGRYRNRAFDAHVDSAIAARDLRGARAHYRAAYQIIIDDAPAIWLFEPPQLAGVSKRLRTGALRADAWWAGLSTWSVAPGGRVPRDAASRSP